MTYHGLKVDCETLLSRFQEMDSVRYEDFLEIWRDMKFSHIFLGGMRNLERNEFTKEALSIASLYFLLPYTFQIRVGALYLLYGLYNLQHCQPKQKIRIALKDWTEIERFQKDLISAQHLDAAYIFRQMRLSRAFHFTAMPTFLTFRNQRSATGATGKEEFKDNRNRVADLFTSDTLEEMQNIHEHYLKAKCSISSDKSQPDKALSLVKDDFVDNLKGVVTDHQMWKLEKTAPRTKNDEEKEGNSQESEGSERARALAKIKSKSYGSVTVAAKSRRHRQVEMASSKSESSGDRKRSRKPRAKRERKRKSRSTRLAVIPEDSSSSSEEKPVIKKKKKV
ncbi:snRNA-activating protein complex subunit 1 [Pelodytes ibericus]